MRIDYVFAGIAGFAVSLVCLSVYIIVLLKLNSREQLRRERLEKELRTIRDNEISFVIREVCLDIFGYLPLLSEEAQWQQQIGTYRQTIRHEIEQVFGKKHSSYHVVTQFANVIRDIVAREELFLDTVGDDVRNVFDIVHVNLLDVLYNLSKAEDVTKYNTSLITTRETFLIVRNGFQELQKSK
ncbi:MAG: hypothetical protein ABFQ53_00705 [Patescibacteria group bacterium]